MNSKNYSTTNVIWRKSSSSAAFQIAAALCLSAFSPGWTAVANNKTDNCISSIGRQENVGHLGVAAMDLESGDKYFYHGDDRFPLQSVFKAPLAVAVLQQVDAGKLSLKQKITIKPEDLSVNYSPIKDHFPGSEQTFTVADLVEKAVQDSDNTAADVLLRHLGGPQKLTDMLKQSGIMDMRVDRYERQLQPDVLGLPVFNPGQLIDQEKWQDDKQHAAGPGNRQAFQRYLHDDPRDKSTPAAMLTFLEKLYKGQLLTASSTKYMLDVMAGTRTGVHRLREGLPQGATLAHKTGTGPDLNGVNSATNDVGIITLPNGKHLIVAVFLSGSALSEADRDKVINSVCKCVVTK